MRFAIIIHQVISPDANGSQVACWAIARYLLEAGHEVVVCPLLEDRVIPKLGREFERIEETGAKCSPIAYSARADKTREAQGLASKIRYWLGLAPVSTYIPWFGLRDLVESRLREIKADAILLYDFPALSAALGVHVAPKLAVAVDLWHLTVSLRWQVEKGQKALRTQLKEWILFRRLNSLYESSMLRVLADCDLQIEFAAHHAEWLQEHGLPEVMYFPTPVEDPPIELPFSKWQEASIEKPRILLIGNLSGVATRLGLELFADEILPGLENRLGIDGFEARVVGGGRLPEYLAKKLSRPSIKMVGPVRPPDDEFLKADVVLVPTPNELGMRVRIAVAFAYGGCVVAHVANAAGIPELKHEWNVLLGATGDELAEQIARAVRDRDLRCMIRRNARTTFETHFESRIASGRIANELVRLAKDNRRSSEVSVDSQSPKSLGKALDLGQRIASGL